MKTKVLMKERVHMVTLGCSKNLVDSEQLLRQLEASHFQTYHNSEKNTARTVIINTCGFILDAKNESIETILRYAKAKEKGRIDKLYVMGCLSQRYKDELRQEIPSVDAFFGVNQMSEIIDSLGGKYRKELLGERQLSTPQHYAYLKISEGCDRTCAFCSIPAIRGKHVSRPMEEIMKEAGFLARQGVKELLLIAQDLSYYGIDLYHKQQLPELLEELLLIQPFEWVRMHYLFPNRFPYEILRLMQHNPRICQYLDIPLQHIADSVLSKMRRGINEAGTRRLIEKIRTSLPDVHLRTTLMVGHPGETDKDFEKLLAFVRESKFERMGAFIYSHEEDTFAYTHYRDAIPMKIKQQRLDRLMESQREISNNLNNNKIGNLLKVIIDRREGDYFIGRTEFDSPEVDNEVIISPGTHKMVPGEFVNVHITGAEDFDLYGMITKKGRI
jgi:ribosomal protein S12 methylthiotransferase